MDESPEQTRRIHERMGLLRTERGLELRQQADAIARRHWNAQRLLEPLPVVIPYAHLLTFPSAWLRTRRDYARFLNLIEVSAFLHQHQRERRGAIVASLADYAMAYALAAEVLSDTLTDLKKPLRAFLSSLQGLGAKKADSGEEPVFTRRDARLATALPDHTVKRWLTDLEELEYVAAQTSGKGRTAVYRLAGAAEAERVIAGLLAPQELSERLSSQRAT